MQTHDGISLFKGNCFDVLPTLPSSSVQLFLCDLPYGVLNKQNPHAAWDKPIDLNHLWYEIKRTGTPQLCLCFLCIGYLCAWSYREQQKRFQVHVGMGQESNDGFPQCEKQPLRRHEDIVVFYSKQCKYNLQFTKGNSEPYTRRECDWKSKPQLRELQSCEH